MATSTKDTGYVDNWQAGKTVTECNLHMLTTEDCSDVIFRVGSEKHVVRAHRYVLVSRSCVFHAMFCGPLAEKGDVSIPDIEPDLFKEFLRYLYIDSADITAENVTGLLYTSRKYAVDGLFTQCSSFLEKSLSGENVCQILEQCHDYGDPDLEQKALKILTEAGEEVIKSPGFQDLCSDCLGKFLESDQLKLKEEQIFEATLSWAKGKCKTKSVKFSPENIRRVLGDMKYEIRFASMPLDYLTKVVGPSGILTAEERILIMDKSFDSDIDIFPFKSNGRNSKTVMSEPQRLTNHYVHRHQCVSVLKSWICYEKQDAISFSTNNNIHLVGCQLYGPWNHTESTYSLNILLYDDKDHVIAEPVPKTQRTLQGQKVLNDVIFPDPVPLVAGRTYTICVTLTVEDTYRGLYGLTLVTVDGVEFTFKKSAKSTNGTNTHKGQIPGLVWR